MKDTKEQLYLTIYTYDYYDSEIGFETSDTKLDMEEWGCDSHYYRFPINNRGQLLGMFYRFLNIRQMRWEFFQIEKDIHSVIKLLLDTNLKEEFANRMLENIRFLYNHPNVFISLNSLIDKGDTIAFAYLEKGEYKLLPLYKKPKEFEKDIVNILTKHGCHLNKEDFHLTKEEYYDIKDTNDKKRYRNRIYNIRKTIEEYKISIAKLEEEEKILNHKLEKLA